MARRTYGTNDITGLVAMVIIIWLATLTGIGNLFGQLGLGVILVVGGVWALARSKSVWNDYVKDWKKLPAAKKNQWNEPKAMYYYFNVVVIIPLAIVLGLSLIFLGYFATQV